MCTVLDITPTDKKVGLEIWDKTSGADVIVGSGGSQSGDRTISVASGDNLLLKQPNYTAIDANARVDIYTGWYGQPGIYVNTVFANSAGYWEYTITANTNDCRRYFVYVNNATYSNGISVQIGGAVCGSGAVLSSITIQDALSVAIGSTAVVLIACRSTSGSIISCPVNLSWGSANSSIATVDGSGKVTGVSAGTTIVGCKDFATGVTSNNCTITVTGGSVNNYCCSGGACTPNCGTLPAGCSGQCTNANNYCCFGGACTPNCGTLPAGCSGQCTNANNYCCSGGVCTPNCGTLPAGCSGQCTTVGGNWIDKTTCFGTFCIPNKYLLVGGIVLVMLMKS